MINQSSKGNIYIITKSCSQVPVIFSLNILFNYVKHFLIYSFVSILFFNKISQYQDSEIFLVFGFIDFTIYSLLQLMLTAQLVLNILDCTIISSIDINHTAILLKP